MSNRSPRRDSRLFGGAQNGGGGNRTREVFPPLDAEVTDLDVAMIGALVVGAVHASALMRHETPRGTASCYLHPQTREERFVVDVLAGRVSTEELLEQLAPLGGEAA